MAAKEEMMAAQKKPARKKTSPIRKATAQDTAAAKRERQRQKDNIRRQVELLRKAGKDSHDLHQAIQADRKKRAAGYFKRVARPAARPAGALTLPSFRFLAEGDSWFDYPGRRGGIITHLGKLLQKADILNLAHAGDALQQMLSLPQRTEIALRLKHGQDRGMPFDALLFSGGGNDIIGEFHRWLLPFTPGASAPALIDTASLTGMLTVLKRGYRDLSAIRDGASPATTIFVHGYDYAQPTGKGVVCGFGPWLRPALEARGIVDPQLQAAVVKEVLVQYSSMLRELAAALPKFVYIETQGLLNPGRDWDNEIHPTPDGFEKLAVAFKNALVTQFPGLP